MKKFLKLFFVVLIVLVIGGVYYVKTPWIYLKDGIYIQKKSIKQEGIWRTAVFKTMNTKERKAEQARQKTKEAKYENPLYSYEKMKKGYEFSDKIKLAIYKKDIATFAEFVSFPITLRTHNNQEINIQDKEQLIQLGVNRIFTDKFINEVCKDEDLFVSYRGFMMGNGPNLFFDYIYDTDVITIYAINIE